MSRRPLAPDLWEQALINGRIVSPGSDQEALEYAEKWYARQGGLFDGAEAAPEPVEPAPEPVAEPAPEQEPEQEPEQVEEAEPASISGLSRRTRARKVKGQFQGDDPATPNRDEAFTEG
jgi:hypothetical protein